MAQLEVGHLEGTSQRHEQNSKQSHVMLTEPSSLLQGESTIPALLLGSPVGEC